MTTERASCIAPFDGITELARPLFATAPPFCDYYFNVAIKGVLARHALAEIAVGSSRGENGDLVQLAKRYMGQPPPAAILVDAYVSGFLFGAWASIETTVFAANALGQAVAPNGGFLPVQDSASVRRVDPSCVLGTKTKKPLPAFAAHLPRFNAAVLSHRGELDALAAQHNASKHRTATAAGGEVAIGGAPPEVVALLLQRAAWSNVLLHAQPEQSIAETTDQTGVLFDSIVEQWRRVLYAIGHGLRAEVASRQPPGSL